MAAIERPAASVTRAWWRPLLKFVEECPCPLATRRAVESLGHYQAREEQARGRSSSTSSSSRSTSRTSNRWQVLADAVPGSLNRLTGRDVATLDGWVALVAEARDDLGSLFPKEDAGA